MPGDFIPDDPSDFIADVPDFIPDAPPGPARAAAAPPGFDDGPIRVRSGSLGSSGAPPRPPGSAPTIGSVVSQIKLPDVYHGVMSAAHVPAAALDSIVGDLFKGQSKESLRQSLAQAEQDLAGIAPNDKGDRSALEHKIQGIKDALDNPASGIPETHQGAAGELVRKASVLSPTALPGHLARAAAALDLPGGKFAKAGIEGVEKAGSELIADPSSYLIPGHAGVAAMFLPQVAESLGTSVGELTAELEKTGWKLTPELGEKLGQTAVGAGFAALLGHGVAEGAHVGTDQAPAAAKAHDAMAASLEGLQEHGIDAPAELTPVLERRSAERLEGLSTQDYVTKFTAMDPEAKAAELQRLHKQAYTDPLTGLGNRAAFMERINSADAPPIRISWDVEGLKWANDNLPSGHLAGDAILKATADALREVGVGENNTFRTGGDEFWSLALTPEEAQAHIQKVQERLRQSEFVVTEPDGTQHRYRDIRLWGGFGEHDPSLPLDQQLARAEAAQKAAKETAVAEGTRAARGERPRSLVEITQEAAGGDQVSRGAGTVESAGAPEFIPDSAPAAAQVVPPNLEYLPWLKATGREGGKADIAAFDAYRSGEAAPAPTPTAEPPVPPGHIRLYRGDGPDGPVMDPNATSMGRRFTSQRAYAEKWAQERGGKVNYVDVPEDALSDSSLAGKFEFDPFSNKVVDFADVGHATEILVPEKIAARSQELESAEPIPARDVPPGGPVTPGLDGGSEAGALLTKTPDQPVVPLSGYDSILKAREEAKAEPGLYQRLKEKLTPTALKTMLLEEEAPIFAAAQEVSEAMGVPGKFDAESSPIPRDPRLMLPLLKNTGALARHDSIVLGRVQKAARSEGLLGYVTQYLDLLGGERRMSQAERALVQKQREAQLHSLASINKRRTGGALGVESRLTNQLTTGQRPKMFKRAAGPMTADERVNLAFKTLPRVRERLGSLYAGERAAGNQSKGMSQALAGKFVKARKGAAALKAQIHGKEVHPLFSSSKDVAGAFEQFEAALSPEQLTRVQELASHVLDVHRRNLDLAYRPSARYGGSKNGLLTEAQYNELHGRLVGPEGTEYAPLNRILDKLEGGTGWAGGAGLTSSQRAWLKKYKSGSKNAPVNPFDAALASSMRLFSDLAHNAAADSIYQLGVQGKKSGVDVGIRKLRGDEKPRPDEIALSVRKKGQLIKFAAPADFGPALLAKAAPELSGLAMGTLRKARNLLREGVINLYPFFAVSNVPVDLIDTLLLGRVHTTKLGKYNPAKYAVGVAHWVAALGDTIKESPEYMEALWHGALGSTFTHAARAERGATPLPGAPVGIGGAIKNVLETVGQKTEEASKVYGFKESLRRLTELEKAGRKTTNPKELLAAYEAMKFVGTPDVMTHGKAIPEANVLLPFLNVGIQGTVRMFRRFQAHPKEFLLPTLATITATEAALLAWNAQFDDGDDKEKGRELDHVPQDEKDNYWSVILPESAFGRYPENGRLHRVKIRKPQPVRIMAGPIRDLLAGAFTASHPDYLQTGINALTESQPIPGLHINPSKPVSSIASSAAAAQNPLIKLTLEQISNMDYLRGTPIERRAEQGRAPSERYDERTSPTAVVISQAITKAASYLDKARGGMLDSEGNPRELLQDVVPGPKRIEHGVRTLTGGLGQMAMGVLDPLAAKLSPQAPRAREPVENIPVLNDLLRRLVTLAPRDSQREKLTDGFYDRYDQLDEVVKTYPVLMRSNPERAAAFLRERGISEFGQARGEYVAMVNASAALARMYKEARAATTSAAAKQINDRINELLKQVVQERKRRAAGAGPAVPAPGLPGLGKPPSASSAIDVADENSLVPVP